MKIVTIIGARPQFIKAAPVCRAIQDYNLKKPNDQIVEIIVHTGQHYDYDMSQIFFDEMRIPEPNINLGVGSGTHGQQTGQMLIRIEEVLLAEKPDWVLVYGDTNSTLAGTLAAAKLHIPVAHVEAGLRSYNRRMPEEINRVLTDHCSDILFCPTLTAVKNLQKEGITGAVNNGEFVEFLDPISLNPCPLPLVVNVGDVMYDSMLYNLKLAKKRPNILKLLNLEPRSYVLTTIHRAENTDNTKRLRDIIEAIVEISKEIQIIFPVHPRTKQCLKNSNFKIQNSALKFISPVSYLDMLMLEKNARRILTDSGGMQKEAYFFGVPCVTMRTETEWVETVEAGWNIVVEADREKIVEAFRFFKTDNPRPKFYGDGHAAEKILDILQLTYGA